MRAHAIQIVGFSRSTCENMARVTARLALRLLSHGLLAMLALSAVPALTSCGASGQAVATASRPPVTASRSSSPGSPNTWVRFSLPGGGISVLLPSNPIVRTGTVPLGPITLTTRLAVLREGRRAFEVASVRMSKPMAAPSLPLQLRAAVYSFAGSSGATIANDRSAAFRGLSAHEASMTFKGGQYELIAIARDSSTIVMVFAPAGSSFSRVLGSVEFT